MFTHALRRFFQNNTNRQTNISLYYPKYRRSKILPNICQEKWYFKGKNKYIGKVVGKEFQV